MYTLDFITDIRQLVIIFDSSKQLKLQIRLDKRIEITRY